MSKKISTVIQYIINNFPSNHKLDGRLIAQLVYLSDWKMCIEEKERLIDVQWQLEKTSFYNEKVNHLIQKELARKTKRINNNKLSDNYKQFIDFSLDFANRKIRHDITLVVVSTYPALTTELYTDFDIIEKAIKYNQLKTGI